MLTTPYVLVETSRADWTSYLRRSLLENPGAGADDRGRLHAFMKYGNTPRGWHEFVMRGYDSHEQNAVYLAGIPDVPGSLPHA